MLLSAISSILIFLVALLAMAFYTLLERKILGYIQIRKGPNKVGLMGLPQPFADALKLFVKEQKQPSLANMTIFFLAPALSLFLTLVIWSFLPSMTPNMFLMFSILLFLCASSLSVYATLGSGWSSNSKYSLIGALRSIAQTISYEVSMTLILLSILFLFMSFSFFHFYKISSLMIFMVPITFFMWFISTLAETNRSPFDFAEGESELVSGFNTEYSSGAFALIFMAEYASILIMSYLTAILFIPMSFYNFMPFSLLAPAIFATLVSFLYIWLRGTLPRMRYDRLMSLTWKCFLPFALSFMILLLPMYSY